VRWLLFIMLGLPVAAQAQEVTDRFPAQDSGRVDVRYPWRPLRIAKWTTLLASSAVAAYGFSQNRVADNDYEELERECEANPPACARGPGNDAYLDPALEQRYQQILERDDRARIALLGGQLGILASVVMFIIDLPDRATPEDIPYEPKAVRFGLRRDGRTELGFQLRIGGL
jgi:hypothetical protein